MKDPWWVDNIENIKCWCVLLRKVSFFIERNLRPSLFHKLLLITEISNNQLPLVKWDFIYLLKYVLREALSNELASVDSTEEDICLVVELTKSGM